MTTTVKLPAKHARDWMDRMGRDLGAELVTETERTVTLRLDPFTLGDLKADATHYADSMHGDWTDGEDYRPAARRCLAAIERAGL